MFHFFYYEINPKMEEKYLVLYFVNFPPKATPLDRKIHFYPLWHNPSEIIPKANNSEK